MNATGEAWKHRIAKRLTALTDGQINVTHEPTTYFASEPESKGHLYEGWLGIELGEDVVCLDDRQPESLRVQLAAELRRVANYYWELANKVEVSDLPK